MAVLESRFDANAAGMAENRARHLDLIAQFRDLEAKAPEASAKAEAKFRARGQLLPRERVNLLLDRGQPFLELSTLAGLAMHDDNGKTNVYGGGLIAGIGVVNGVRVMVSANDSGIKGGAAHPLGVEKAIRAQEIALENRLPFIQLVESAGANLLLQAEMFVRGGATFANMARMSAKGLPVVSVVHGSSTAGGAYQTGLADHVILVRGRSKVFLAGPPLLKAATGEIAFDEDLGGAEMHAAISGVGDYLAEDDADAIRMARDIVGAWNWDRVAGPSVFAEPLFDAEDMLSICSPDYRKPYDARELIARLVDGSDFVDFKPDWGVSTVTGFARVEGRAVGILANNGPIDANGAAKAAQFIQLCCQSGASLIFLQNTTGFIVGVEAERAGIVKHGSKMIQAVTNASVPKITLQIGGAFGAGHYAMCGRSFAPRFVFSWPSNRIAVMGGEQAAKVMRIVMEDGMRAKGVEPPEGMFDDQAKAIVAAYDAQSTALFGTARLWDDGLIDPRDSRRVLALCLAVCAEGDARVLCPNSFGVARS
ncbi:MAG: acyl-CoA carboxylase subunit beta [Phyllobacteriaceae bacterium]|nr:acyl-CoA carboxylase subunit beta [Phyllobacteriaceae bacterium]